MVIKGLQVTRHSSSTVSDDNLPGRYEVALQPLTVSTAIKHSGNDNRESHEDANLLALFETDALVSDVLEMMVSSGKRVIRVLKLSEGMLYHLSLRTILIDATMKGVPEPSRVEVLTSSHGQSLIEFSGARIDECLPSLIQSPTSSLHPRTYDVVVEGPGSSRSTDIVTAIAQLLVPGGLYLPTKEDSPILLCVKIHIDHHHHSDSRTAQGRYLCFIRVRGVRGSA